MKIFDEKFSSNKIRYILQCGLATLSVFIVLLILGTMSNVVIIAALGSSAFIVFTMPESQVSRPRFLIGGYLVGIATGLICYYLSLLTLLTRISIVHEYSLVVFGSLSVGLAIFTMVITDTEHPPAAGLSFGLILSEWSYMTIFLAIVGIITLSVIKAVLRPLLRNLL
jgi:CBS-domain-containing membrane protein